MKRILLIILLIIIISGCSGPKSFREQERETIKEKKPLVDKLTIGSSEEEIQTALDFCDEILPDSMEICYIDVATRLPFERARQICNTSEAFEYNHHKNQAQCYAELALPEEDMKICELDLEGDLIYECYAKLGSMLIEKGKNAGKIAGMIKQKCDAYPLLLEYGDASDRDSCLEKTTEVLSWLDDEKVNDALFANCMSIIGGKKVECLKDIELLEKATNKKILEYCGQNMDCIAFGQDIQIEKGDFDSAIALCDVLPAGQDKNDCYIWIVRKMEDPEKMLEVCEQKVTQGKHSAQMSQNKKDVCYTETAERFAGQGDIRAAELCGRLPGWRWPCVENIIGRLDTYGSTEIALTACDILDKEEERTRCIKRLE